jgi:hypothetical protein
MSFKSKVSTTWNWTKSCFNSSAWYEAAQDHVQKAAPLIENIANSPKTTLVIGGIFASVMYKSQTAKDLVKWPGNLAKECIEPKLEHWGNFELQAKIETVKNVTLLGQTYEVGTLTTQNNESQEKVYKNVHSQIDGSSNRTYFQLVSTQTTDSTNNFTTITNELEPINLEGCPQPNFVPQMQTISDAKQQRDTTTWTVANAIGQGAENTAKIVGGVVVLAGMYALSNAATKLTKAAVVDRSKDAVKAAAFESLEDANALRHAFQAVGDCAGGVACNILIDAPVYLVSGLYNQTIGCIGRLSHHDEQDTDIAGETIEDADPIA